MGLEHCEGIDETAGPIEVTGGHAIVFYHGGVHPVGEELVGGVAMQGACGQCGDCAHVLREKEFDVGIRVLIGGEFGEIENAIVDEGGFEANGGALAVGGLAVIVAGKSHGIRLACRGAPVGGIAIGG